MPMGFNMIASNWDDCVKHIASKLQVEFASIHLIDYGNIDSHTYTITPFEMPQKLLSEKLLTNEPSVNIDPNRSIKMLYFVPLRDFRGILVLGRQNPITPNSAQVEFVKLYSELIYSKIIQNETQEKAIILQKIFLDITEPMNAHEVNAASIMQMARHICHDIRGRVGTVRFALESYLQNIIPTADIIHSLIGELDEVVHMLSSIATPYRTKVLMFQKSSLRECLDNILDSINFDPYITLEKDLAQAPEAFLDYQALDYCITELANNALFYVGKGTVKIKAQTANIPNNPMPFAEIIFEDSGPGLAPSVEGIADQLGVTTSAKACGMGLANIKRILEVQGGKMELSKSEELGGLKVSLRFPIEPTC